MNPGGAFPEAQQQRRERFNQSDQLAAEPHRLQQALHEKASERERVMTLFRRGRATIQDTERQLDAIEKEAAELRTTLSALKAQQDLANAYEAQYTEATGLLERLQDRLEDIECTNDVQTKRQVIDLLVAGIRAETVGEGKKKHVSVVITYTFTPQRVAISYTNTDA